ncbi:DEAD/DEAH box helicase [Nocardioides oleivorans]|uniref:DEAD/DEAH box helicase n=1 Tax=Nocardioides oleivorans TaxID=273676 RepID=A0A4Q2S2F0_9ACTN|nr:DEAD/DEAH box helicase [Nocardioides oleivorans]
MRIHQREALESLARAWDGSDRPRAWVVLPPGAGKTRVGLEAVADRLRADPAVKAVVLAPNTAIQSQWIAEARVMGLDASDDRSLAAALTCLTYQSLAVFDSEATDAAVTVVDRLHPNGVALFDRIRTEPDLVLVLDECHHLLEVWGRLLAELLEAVSTAHVLALTATPPESLTAEQRALVDELFGSIRYRVSVPAVVKEGHLAPFDELVWLTTPTPTEEDWLTGEALRFTELTTLLTTPGFGSVGFYEWLTARYVDPVPATTTWAALAEREPDLCDAALRMHHAGLLGLPVGARLREEHRHPPSAEDWVGLLGDWLLHHVAVSSDVRDAEVLATVKAALPSVGYAWTRRGVRRGRSTVDRVLARSYAKPGAAAQIIAAEHAAIGVRARVLVLCDHERASATVPVTLDGVQDAEAGSAVAALEALLAAPDTAVLQPMLVTGSVVAASESTLRDLVAFVATRDPQLAGRLVVSSEGVVATCTAGWTSRTWVGHVTAFFESGGTQVLVGTRGLLGEGWNARGVSTLIDLTTATTLTAVVQTRGRALRTDPTWPEKVATNWTVVCVSEAHPKGDNDWFRLVRKHQGFHGVDADGDIVDGVAHIDASFSPFAPPPVASFDGYNARMLVAAADRDAIRDLWRVGEPYQDVTLASLRVRRSAGTSLAPPDRVVVLTPVAPTWRLTSDGLSTEAAVPDTSWRTPLSLAAGTAGVGGVAAVLPGVGQLVAAGALGVLAAGGAVISGHRNAEVLTAWVHSQLALTTGVPPLEAVAAAVADALLAAGLTGVGASALAADVHPGGEYRFRLVGSEADAEVFAAAFDEAIAPVGAPRYLVSRWTSAQLRDPGRRIRTRAGARSALAAAAPSGEAWHPVPTVLGRNATSAGHYLATWRTWVGDGRLLATARPEGAGILTAVSGEDPFAATTVMRRQWS